MTQIYKFAVTSDWHIGHHNCLNFDNRPFKDLNHMHTVLANNINACLDENDVLYVLGDYGFTKNNEVQEFMKRLGNFTKIAILGNHDKGYNATKDMGFDLVLNSAQIHMYGIDITMSHCPPNGFKREDCTLFRNHTGKEDYHGQRKNKRFSVDYDPEKLHLHGHTHLRPDKEDMITNVKEMNLWDIGVVGNNYRPVMKSEIESHIFKLKQQGILK